MAATSTRLTAELDSKAKASTKIKGGYQPRETPRLEKIALNQRVHSFRLQGSPKHWKQDRNLRFPFGFPFLLSIPYPNALNQMPQIKCLKSDAKNHI